VARLGGDEFTVILTDMADTSRVDKVASNIRDTLAIPFIINEITLNISGSIGIAIYPDDATVSSDLVTKADIAMYSSKRQGRNRYCFYADDIDS
jgi:diguanylate cyclase (GGDEF)-like protein